MLELSIGNTKLGRDTAIFNMDSATDCVSKKLGLCQLQDCNSCYALKAEIQYPACLPFRKRQALAYHRQEYKSLASDILQGVTRNVKYIRFSEAGDFRHQGDIEKLFNIASELSQYIFYGYTARRDLSYKNPPKNLAINCSGFRRGNMNTFRIVKSYTGNNPTCKGNCRICNLCKKAQSLTIENLLH